MTKNELYALRKSQRICVRCGKEPAVEGRVMCVGCAEKERKRAAENRQALKRLGFCPKCGKNRLYGDENMCLDCSQKMYSYNREHPSVVKRDYIKIRKESGVCIKCGKRRPVIGKTKCGICAAKERKRAREYRLRKGMDVGRSERPANGRCYFCGAEISSGKICDECKERVMKNLPKERLGWGPLYYGKGVAR